MCPPAQPLTIGVAVDAIQNVQSGTGFQYRPFSQVIVRGSFGEGFVPPSGDQLGPPMPRRFQPGAFRRSERGNEPTGAVDFQAGGNPALDPERSRSWSAGLQLEPARERGLQASLTYMELVKVNVTLRARPIWRLADFALFARWYPDRAKRRLPLPMTLTALAQSLRSTRVTSMSP